MSCRPGPQNCDPVTRVVPAPPPGTVFVGSWRPAFAHPAHVCNPNALNSGPLPGFNTVHACLIPVDPTLPSNPNGGKVLVWDTSRVLSYCASLPANGDYVQRYAIVDPQTQTFQLGQFLIPNADAPPAHTSPPGTNQNGYQGLFCSGHCWLRDGKLLVAGGDDWSFPNAPPKVGYVGSRLVCLFDPWAATMNTQWSVLRETGVGGTPPFPLVHLQRRRWYPTLVRLADDQDTGIIAGGVEHWDTSSNWYNDNPIDYGPRTYEAIHTWNPNALPARQEFLVDNRNGIVIGGTAQPGLFSGPTPAFPATESLFYYPRLHLTSKHALGGASLYGLTWAVAFPSDSTWVEHLQGQNMWPGPHPSLPFTPYLLEEPSTVLMPNFASLFEDVIVSIGGEIGLSHTQASITNAVRLLDTKAINPTWTQGPPMYYPRKF
ncbi:MAG: hypothetical protein KDC98_09040, partial [Planctomycetes bacterium]|nr:hypothetical protein [Planctomycetota bacterium]